jgi:molecular chaperone GrpE (heat shock protein)
VPDPTHHDETSDAPVQREEEDDYDLLTFGEAGARLDQEVRTLKRQVAELETGMPRDDAELDSARNRLAALVDAAERNARQPITDENFTRFFGYEGKARRNTE